MLAYVLNLNLNCDPPTDILFEYLYDQDYAQFILEFSLLLTNTSPSLLAAPAQMIMTIITEGKQRPKFVHFCIFILILCSLTVYQVIEYIKKDFDITVGR